VTGASVTFNTTWPPWIGNVANVIQIASAIGGILGFLWALKRNDPARASRSRIPSRSIAIEPNERARSVRR
jgi:hypothetical protein